jgi:putative holliday junction resolvase
MRIISLDVGEKTIGIAATDPNCVIAEGVTTITRGKLKEDLAAIYRYVQDFRVDMIVVGVPYEGDEGDIGKQAETVIQFKRKLDSFLNDHGSYVRSVTWDESMTTHEADEILAQANVSTRKRNRVIDKLAAVMILESYMRANPPPK